MNILSREACKTRISVIIDPYTCLPDSNIYKTIVADLATGQVVYAGNGKSADAFDEFWRKMR